MTSSCGLALPPLGDMVRAWIKEDVPSFDIGGAVVGEKMETATLFCKAPVGGGYRRP
jgi:nicotinate-nucleotide pyrophosphorylase (carboxylating)